jgi:hypothetical protein
MSGYCSWRVRFFLSCGIFIVRLYHQLFSSSCRLMNDKLGIEGRIRGPRWCVVRVLTSGMGKSTRNVRYNGCYCDVLTVPIASWAIEVILYHAWPVRRASGAAHRSGNFGRSRALPRVNRTEATLLPARENAAYTSLVMVTPVLYSVIDLLLSKFVNNRSVSAAIECLESLRGRFVTESDLWMTM